MRTLALAAVLLTATLATTAVIAAGTADNYWPADAKAYIISPKNGARLKSPVTVVFGLKGLGIAPAGVKFPNTGHFHLLVDTDVPADLSAPLPMTANILHYGKGQTEVTLDASKLPAGKHTLQLLIGDESHIPHNPALLSKMITITVQ
jgi:Domain of unknown function (DUF4399)